MKKTYAALFLAIVISLTILAGCNSSDSNTSQENITGNTVTSTPADETDISIDKLEIFHFHGTNQCHSCVTVGDYAEETVKTYFQEELEKGIIVFDHINGELPENKELVMKYGTTGSSLWLGTYDDGEFNAQQNTKVWYKINNKQDYMNYLKGVIEQKLTGN